MTMQEFEGPRPETPKKLPYLETVNFVSSSLATDAPQIVLNSADRPHFLRTLTQGLGIVKRYYLTDDSLADIAADLDCTDVEAGRKRNIAFTNLWSSSPVNLRAQYPLPQLERNKPPTTKKKLKISRNHGGVAAKYLDALQNPNNQNLKQQQQELSVIELQRARAALRKLGYEVPTLRRGWDNQRELDSSKPSSMTDDEKMNLLTKLTLTNVRNNSGPEGKLAMTREVVEGAECHFSGGSAKLTEEVLKQLQIPHLTIVREIKSGPKQGRKQRSTFLFRSDLLRAIYAIKFDPKFSRFKRPDASW